ncbi:MAG: DUF3160 domain-containing protein [Deltaproteobacteria bacterium]|nr:DUF3160 domain-containing protein [Deltaproteobacteria bacterium]MBN2670059.1 DUF3160 domain-containing protein [Deltaproteobacteria bacterium]
MNRKFSFALKRRAANSRSLFTMVIFSAGCVLLVSSNCHTNSFIWYASYPEKEMPLVVTQNNHSVVDAAFADFKEKFSDISVQQFQHRNRLSYAEFPATKLNKVQFVKQASDAFSFSSTLKRQLSQNGFGVIPATTPEMKQLYGKGFSSIYYEIYEADLPVFVTVDAIFHAFHRSFDLLMETAEERILVYELYDLLRALLMSLDASDAAERNMMVYLAVPFYVLEEIRLNSYNDPPRDFEDPPILKDDMQQEVQAYIDMIYSETTHTIHFFGKPVEQDFSVFYPRGHYGKSMELQGYFRAMKWLNHMPLMVYAPNEEMRMPAHENMVRVLLKKINETSQWGRYRRIHSFYTKLMGSDNSIDLQTLYAACGERKAMCATVDSRYANTLRRLSIERSLHGQAEPVLFKFFPTKFEYTAWVTEQTTQPQLNPQQPNLGRSMASPMDVAYALGANRAAAYLKTDLNADDGPQLASALLAARKTMATVSPSQVANTPTGDWLRALMAASLPTVQTNVPDVMKTALWHDRKMEGVLASWTEMRHDTLLMVEAMGGSGCDFPKAYVEPIPGVYDALTGAVRKMALLYETILAEGYEMDSFFTHFEETLARLKTISEQELAGEAVSGDDLLFINEMMKMQEDTYTGERLYDGWYPRLYWTPYYRSEYSAESGTDEPLVADVYTDMNSKQVLEVATGHPGILFVVMEMNGERVLYSGAVSSFYEFTVSAEDRLNDTDWREKLMEQPPKRPIFTRDYWVEPN